MQLAELPLTGQKSNGIVRSAVDRIGAINSQPSPIDRRSSLIFHETPLKDVLIVEPKIFGDERGFFLETFNEREFADRGLPTRFVQDNYSGSRKDVLRGIHYQLHQPQGKLVRVLSGEVFDVAVDLRRDSPQFGEWFGISLVAANHRMLWIPPGFGHAFLVVSEFAEFTYKTTDFYAPKHERTIGWNDPAIAIKWPLDGKPILSAKDSAGQAFEDAETYPCGLAR